MWRGWATAAKMRDVRCPGRRECVCVYGFGGGWGKTVEVVNRGWGPNCIEGRDRDSGESLKRERER